jgi:hypothetical protein
MINIYKPMTINDHLETFIFCSIFFGVLCPRKSSIEPRLQPHVVVFAFSVPS